MKSKIFIVIMFLLFISSCSPRYTTYHNKPHVCKVKKSPKKHMKPHGRRREQTKKIQKRPESKNLRPVRKSTRRKRK